MFSNQYTTLIFLSLIFCKSIVLAADCGKCQNCKTINSKNQCIKCIDGYSLDPTGSSCVKDQIPLSENIGQSYVFKSSITEISQSSSSKSTSNQNVDPNCDIILNNGVCRRCIDRFFLNKQTQKCQPLSPLCKEWSQKGKCLSCVPGYSVNSDLKCVPAAQNQTIKKQNSSQTKNPVNNILNNTPVASGQKKLIIATITDGPNNLRFEEVRIPDLLNSGISFDFSNFTGEIFTVDPYCEKYEGRVCKKCQFRYIMIQKICKRVSNTCSEWDETGKCTVCYSGFNLNDKGQCVTFIIDQSLQTFQGAIKIENSTLNKSSSNSSPGVSSKPTEAQSQKSSGIVASIILGPVDPNCDRVGDNGLCARCKFKFYIQKGLCRAVSQLCSAWSISTGACTECYEGYSVSGTACVQDPPEKKIPTEISADNQFQQFIARYNKKNIQQNQKIPNCALAKKGFCEICDVRFYNMNGVCMAVSDLCNTYNESTGQCTSCKDGFMLSDTTKGLCITRPITIPRVPNRIQGSFSLNDLAQLNKKAQAIKAQTQQSFQSSNKILNKLQQHRMKQSQIKELSQIQNKMPNFNQFIVNNIIGCSQIGVTGLCTKCAFRFVKSNGGCKKVNDLCKSWSLSHGGCTQCYDGYNLKQLECVLQKL